MHSRTLLLAAACLFACVLPARADFDARLLHSPKADCTRTTQPDFAAAVANARPTPRVYSTNELVVAIQFAGVARVAFIIPAPPAPMPPPSAIKNPSNVPRQRH